MEPDCGQTQTTTPEERRVGGQPVQVGGCTCVAETPPKGNTESETLNPKFGNQPCNCSGHVQCRFFAWKTRLDQSYNRTTWTYSLQRYKEASSIRVSMLSVSVAKFRQKSLRASGMSLIQLCASCALLIGVSCSRMSLHPEVRYLILVLRVFVATFWRG